MLLTLLSVCSKLFTVCVRRFLKYIPVRLQIIDRAAQSVTCLAVNTCLTADPGVPSSILAR